MAFCMKIFWLINILMFFVSFPISSRWPQYRFVVSLLRLPFWDIPTNGTYDCISPAIRQYTFDGLSANATVNPQRNGQSNISRKMKSCAGNKLPNKTARPRQVLRQTLACQTVRRTAQQTIWIVLKCHSVAPTRAMQIMRQQTVWETLDRT